MAKLTDRESQYWNEYLESLPHNQRPMNAFVSSGFAGTAEITDELLALYLAGKKTAGSSVLEAFKVMGDRIPQIGDYWIYLNSKLEPSAILRTENIVYNKFSEIPLKIAIAEGEGDLSLDYWRRVHTELWEPNCREWGLASIAEATILTEYFSLQRKR